MNKLEEIRFPAIIIGKDQSMIDAIRDRSYLETVNKEAVNRGIFVNAKIFDTKGVEYTIIDIQKKEKRFPWWKFEFFNPSYFVNLEIDTSNTLNTSELKNEIINRLISQEEIWNETPTNEKNQLTINLDQASDISEIVKVMSDFYLQELSG